MWIVSCFVTGEFIALAVALYTNHSYNSLPHLTPTPIHPHTFMLNCIKKLNRFASTGPVVLSAHTASVLGKHALTHVCVFSSYSRWCLCVKATPWCAGVRASTTSTTETRLVVHLKSRILFFYKSCFYEWKIIFISFSERKYVQKFCFIITHF